MGCASSRVGPNVSHVPENTTIPHRIRRRLDSIRRRRRVADSLINSGKEPTSLSKKMLLETTESDKLGSSPNCSRDDLDQEMMKMSSVSEEDLSVDATTPNNSMPLERDRADCIAEAVKRAIDDVMLEEEEEEAAGDHDHDDDGDDDAGRRVVARGKVDDDGELQCIGSPSFRFYCEDGPKPFGSFASIDYEVKSVEDIPKANHESTESFESKESFESEPTPIPDYKEGSSKSSSSSSKKSKGTKKVGSWGKKGPIGMKMLLNNFSCYSCAANPAARNRLVHN